MQRASMAVAFLAGLLVFATLAAVTLNRGREAEIRKVTVTFTTDGSGADTETISYMQTSTTGGITDTPMAGLLYRFTTVPGSGASSPTANWDLVVVDSSAVDILQGAGANRSQSTTESVILASPTAFADALEARMTNGGGTRTATLELYIGPP